MVLASEFGRVGKVKYPGVGKKTHSVFEGLFYFPMCISNPNFAKCRKSRGDTNFQLVSRFEDKSSVIDVEHTEELEERSTVERSRLMADELAVR